jgi:hypothetical protein
MAKSLKSASKAATTKANLAKLGSIGQSKVDFTSGSGLAAVESVIGDFIKKVINNINSANIIDTGEITNITAEVSGDGGVVVKAPAHLDYQSKGVNGTETSHGSPYSYGDKMPPISVIEAWAKRKGMENPKQAAFAISKSIQREGITPKHLYENEIPELAKELQVEISKIVMDLMKTPPVKKDINL